MNNSEYKSNNKGVLSLLFLWMMVGILSAQEANEPFGFKGFVDSYHAMRLDAPNDLMSSRTRFRGELSKAFGRSSLFVSFNLNQNSLLKEQNGFELREAYLDYTSSKWGLRVGRQLIIWGAADGLRITDLVSPMDMTEFLARDYDDIRMPVEALRFSYFKDFMKIELVYVPVFKGFVLPTDESNPWAITMPQIENLETCLLEAQKPSLTLKNGEIGGRVIFNLPSIDVSLSALHTYNKNPNIKKYIQDGCLYLAPEYHRMTFVGGDFSKPLNQFVFRGECAFMFNKSILTEGVPSVIQKHHTLNMLLGVDWYAEKEWMLSMQLSNEKIFDYKEPLEAEENTALLTMNVSKKLLNSTLSLSDFIYVDLNNSGFFNRFTADYALTDQIHLLAGCDVFHGDKGMFRMYNKNSELFFKAKYSF